MQRIEFHDVNNKKGQDEWVSLFFVEEGEAPIHVDFLGFSFELEPGIWMLGFVSYWKDQPKGKKPWGPLPQPIEKWEEAKNVEKGRKVYWHARSQALKAGLSVSAANKSAEKHREKLDLPGPKILSVQEERRLEVSDAAVIFRQEHGIQVPTAWQFGSVGNVRFAEFRTTGQRYQIKAEDWLCQLNEDVWGNVYSYSPEGEKKLIISIIEFIN